MTEIKKTLIILKTRWLEVVFLIVLYISRPLLAKLFFWLAANKTMATSYVNFLHLILSILIMLVLITARSGFLRTVYLQDRKRQSAFTLLQVGIHFLWRMLVCGLIYMMPFLIWILLYPRIVTGFIRPGDLSFPHFGFWINPLFFAGIKLALMKIILLVPALIIVSDCRVFSSFKMLKQYRLSSMKELVILYCVSIAIGFLWMVLPLYRCGASCGTVSLSATATSQEIVRIIFSVITEVIGLMIVIMAVKFVGSFNLSHYEKSSEPYFEDLQINQNNDVKE